jgi:hypothetical protein
MRKAVYGRYKGGSKNDATVLTECVLGVRADAAEDVRLAVVAVLERFLYFGPAAYFNKSFPSTIAELSSKLIRSTMWYDACLQVKRTFQPIYVAGRARCLRQVHLLSTQTLDHASCS